VVFYFFLHVCRDPLFQRAVHGRDGGHRCGGSARGEALRVQAAREVQQRDGEQPAVTMETDVIRKSRGARASSRARVAGLAGLAGSVHEWLVPGAFLAWA
jgi:hypothetical protein